MRMYKKYFKVYPLDTKKTGRPEGRPVQYKKDLL